MKYYEIHKYMKALCKIINNNLNEIANNHCDHLPLFVMFNAHACYVRYDTQKECITHVTLEAINQGGIAVEIDPIAGVITGVVEDKPCELIEMKKETASTILQCITVCWKKRLSEEGLISLDGGGRFIAADLLG